MILPIKLTGSNGMRIGSGVPSFVINPITGEPFGIGVDAHAASSADPATGEPATSEAGQASDYTNDAGLWDTSAPDTSDVLNTGILRDTRGTQWNRRGSYLTESDFDKWRKAGKPTACSMRGLRGSSTFPDGTPCDPGMSDPRLCQTTAERILMAVASGASAAAQPYYPNYAQPYYGGSQPGGSVTVSGGGSSMAWIFGGLIVVGLAYVAMKR